MRWKLMAFAVSRQEGHARLADQSNGDSVARFAIGRFERDLTRIVKQGVEAGAADDSDIRNVLGLDRSSLFSDEVDETTPELRRRVYHPRRAGVLSLRGRVGASHPAVSAQLLDRVGRRPTPPGKPRDARLAVMNELVSMIGFGAIGKGVGNLFDQGKIAGVRLEHILIRDLSRVPGSWRHDPPGQFTVEVDRFLSGRASLVVEAAGHGALSKLGEPVLKAGKDLLVVSVGALSDEALHDRLLAAARTGNSRLLIASGAIGALDAISAARVGGLDEVVHTTRKNPRMLFSQTEAEKAIAAGESTVLYDGPAREGVRRFPENVNVAAAVSLAGLGFDRTILRVISDPSVERNMHDVVARGYFGELRLEMRNIPSDANPKTGRIVALSVAKALMNRVAAEVIGV
jgi:aspartate dehydrogenase